MDNLGALLAQCKDSNHGFRPKELRSGRNDDENESSEWDTSGDDGESTGNSVVAKREKATEKSTGVGLCLVLVPGTRDLLFPVPPYCHPPISVLSNLKHPLLSLGFLLAIHGWLSSVTTDGVAVHMDKSKLSPLEKLLLQYQTPEQLALTYGTRSGSVAAPKQSGFVGELTSMCSASEMINKQRTSTTSDLERLPATLSGDPETRLINRFLAVKSFQRSDASRVFLPTDTRPAVWCRRTVHALLALNLTADIVELPWHSLPTKEAPRHALGAQDWEALQSPIRNACSPKAPPLKFIEIYNFMRDRLRSVWQDLTVQHCTKHMASIECLEISFRFLILAEGILSGTANFNSVQNGELMATCLDKLMSGYRDCRHAGTPNPAFFHDKFAVEALKILHYSSPYEGEFWAYRILATIPNSLDNANALLDILRRIPAELLQRDKRVKIALEAHKAFRDRNASRYFKIMNDSDVLVAILLHKYSRLMRVAYLNVLQGSGGRNRPPIPFESFCRLFGLEGVPLDVIEKFCDVYGLRLLRDNNNRSTKRVTEEMSISSVSIEDICLTAADWHLKKCRHSIFKSPLVARKFDELKCYARQQIVDPSFQEGAVPGYKSLVPLSNLHSDERLPGKETALAYPPRWCDKSVEDSDRNAETWKGAYTESFTRPKASSVISEDRVSNDQSARDHAAKNAANGETPFSFPSPECQRMLQGAVFQQTATIESRVSKNVTESYQEPPKTRIAEPAKAENLQVPAVGYEHTEQPPATQGSRRLSFPFEGVALLPASSTNVHPASITPIFGGLSPVEPVTEASHGPAKFGLSDAELAEHENKNAKFLSGDEEAHLQRRPFNTGETVSGSPSSRSRRNSARSGEPNDTFQITLGDRTPVAIESRRGSRLSQKAAEPVSPVLCPSAKIGDAARTLLESDWAPPGTRRTIAKRKHPDSGLLYDNDLTFDESSSDAGLGHVHLSQNRPLAAKRRHWNAPAAEEPMLTLPVTRKVRLSDINESLASGESVSPLSYLQFSTSELMKSSSPSKLWCRVNDAMVEALASVRWDGLMACADSFVPFPDTEGVQVTHRQKSPRTLPSDKAAVSRRRHRDNNANNVRATSVTERRSIDGDAPSFGRYALEVLFSRFEQTSFSQQERPMPVPATSSLLGVGTLATYGGPKSPFLYSYATQQNLEPVGSRGCSQEEEEQQKEEQSLLFCHSSDVSTARSVSTMQKPKVSAHFTFLLPESSIIPDAQNGVGSNSNLTLDETLNGPRRSRSDVSFIGINLPPTVPPHLLKRAVPLKKLFKDWRNSLVFWIVSSPVFVDRTGIVSESSSECCTCSNGKVSKTEQTKNTAAPEQLSDDAASVEDSAFLVPNPQHCTVRLSNGNSWKREVTALSKCLELRNKMLRQCDKPLSSSPQTVIWFCIQEEDSETPEDVAHVEAAVHREMVTAWTDVIAGSDSDRSTWSLASDTIPWDFQCTVGSVPGSSRARPAIACFCIGVANSIAQRLSSMALIRHNLLSRSDGFARLTRLSLDNAGVYLRFNPDGVATTLSNLREWAQLHLARTAYMILKQSRQRAREKLIQNPWRDEAKWRRRRVDVEGHHEDSSGHTNKNVGVGGTNDHLSECGVDMASYLSRRWRVSYAESIPLMVISNWKVRVAQAAENQPPSAGQLIALLPQSIEIMTSSAFLHPFFFSSHADVNSAKTRKDIIAVNQFRAALYQLCRDIKVAWRHHCHIMPDESIESFRSPGELMTSVRRSVRAIIDAAIGGLPSLSAVVPYLFWKRFGPKWVNAWDSLPLPPQCYGPWRQYFEVSSAALTDTCRPSSDIHGGDSDEKQSTVLYEAGLADHSKKYCRTNSPANFLFQGRSVSPPDEQSTISTPDLFRPSGASYQYGLDEDGKMDRLALWNAGDEELSRQRRRQRKSRSLAQMNTIDSSLCPWDAGFIPPSTRRMSGSGRNDQSNGRHQNDDAIGATVRATGPSPKKFSAKCLIMDAFLGKDFYPTGPGPGYGHLESATPSKKIECDTSESCFVGPRSGTGKKQIATFEERPGVTEYASERMVSPDAEEDEVDVRISALRKRLLGTLQSLRNRNKQVEIEETEILQQQAASTATKIFSRPKDV